MLRATRRALRAPRCAAARRPSASPRSASERFTASLAEFSGLPDPPLAALTPRPWAACLDELARLGGLASLTGLVHPTSPYVSYPRRQQLRRLRRAAVAGVGACAAVALALAAAASEAFAAATVMFLVSAALGADARQSARLAVRSGVGARSEEEVRHALQVLEREGWRLRCSLPWQGRGDVDHVAIAPTGVAFAIETKTRTFQPAHLVNVRAQAAWLERHRRRWCPRGAHPVLCVTRGPQLEHIADGVLVVSVNRLAQVLRVGAGTVQRPEFLVPE